MSRLEVRAVLGLKVEPFRKGPESDPLVDAFPGERIHVYYDPQDTCEAVEVATPAEPLLEGRALLGQPFAEVRDWLRSLGSQLEDNDAGLTDFTHGLGLYAPAAVELPDEPVEGVIAFRRGYYD
jgi:hypothetical protein